MRLAQIQHFLAAGVGAVGQHHGGALPVSIHVFDGSNRAHLQAGFELSAGHVAQAHVQDFAFLLQFEHGPELLGQRHRAVAHQAQVHQLQLLAPQRAQVVVGAGAQVFGGVEGRPAFVGPAGGPHFGADNQAGRVGVQGLGNEAVGDVLAVVVGGVQKVYARPDGFSQDG